MIYTRSTLINVMLQATHLGLQRKVLAELGKPQSLVQPSELYQFCLVSGEMGYCRVVSVKLHFEHRSGHWSPARAQSAAAEEMFAECCSGAKPR